MLLAALALVVSIVVGAPHSALVVITIVTLVVMVSLLAQASLRKLLLRSLVVLPIAGGMALFAPLRFLGRTAEAVGSAVAPEIAGAAGLAETVQSTGMLGSLANAYLAGAPLMVQMILTSWLCVLVLLTLATVCPVSDLLFALEQLRLPRALTMLLGFIHRYVDLLRSELSSLSRAMVLRAPTLSRRRQVLLYGNLAGSLVIRTQDRAERVSAAMLARGFTGVLPRRHQQRLVVADITLLVIAVVFSLAITWV